MKFVFPGAAYEEKAKEFFQEFRTSGSSLHGVGGLDRFLETGTYGQWLQKVYQDMDLANIPEGRVPAYTCFYVRERDGCLVGMIASGWRSMISCEKRAGTLAIVSGLLSVGKGMAPRCFERL